MKKNASHLKIANPYNDPSYGQYGRERRDDDGPGVGTALAVGGGLLGGHLLHGGLMDSGGRFARGYQENLGRAIRDRANGVRAKMELPPVAQPPHPILGRIRDAVHGAGIDPKTVMELGKKGMGAAAMGVGVATGAHKMHTELMDADHLAGRLYQRGVGQPLENLAGKVVDRVTRPPMEGPRTQPLWHRAKERYEKFVGPKPGAPAPEAPAPAPAAPAPAPSVVTRKGPARTAPKATVKTTPRR